MFLAGLFATFARGTSAPLSRTSFVAVVPGVGIALQKVCIKRVGRALDSVHANLDRFYPAFLSLV